MSVMSVLHSKRALSDILEGVTSKKVSLASLACLVLFFDASALTLLVMQFTIFQVFRGGCH